jgi:excisionase family DNA binding protein
MCDAPFVPESRAVERKDMKQADTTPGRPPRIAKKVGVSEDTVRNWCKSGAIKAVRIGGSWFVPADEEQRIYESLGLTD